MEMKDIFTAQTYAVLLIVGAVVWLGWFLSQDVANDTEVTTTPVSTVSEGAGDVSQTEDEDVVPPPEFGVVTDVIDSLTIVIDDKYVIRYLGVTAPKITDEVQCFGREALQANESLLKKTVRLEEDPVLTRAKDGAWLRYVWVPEDERSQEAYNEALSGAPVVGLTEPSVSDSDTGNSESQGNDSEDMKAGKADKSDVVDKDKAAEDQDTVEEKVPQNGSEEDSGNGSENGENEDKIKEYLVSERIIEMGLGFPLLSKEMTYYDKLSGAARFSSATKRGLWKQCEISKDENTGLLKTQTINDCVIKGVVLKDGSKVYRTQVCESYKDTAVLRYKDGEWLCSEDEARQKGYTKGVDCP